MKKKIYLMDKNYNYKEFSYNEISELQKELKSRNITIGDSATIGDKTILIKGFYIYSEKHCVTYVGDKKLSIGCHTLKISNWKKNYKEMGENEGYSKEEIKEYYQYILMAEKFSKI